MTNTRVFHNNETHNNEMYSRVSYLCVQSRENA